MAGHCEPLSREYWGQACEHRKVSCLGWIYPFSFRVHRLASRHSKGVEYWGSGLEAVDPMATTGRGGNPCCPNVFGGVKGSRRSVQPFGTSSSRAGDRERPKLEVYSAAWDVSLTSWWPKKAEAGGRSRRSTQPLGTSPHKLVTGRAQ